MTLRATLFFLAMAAPLGAQTGFKWSAVDIPVRDGKTLAADVWTCDSTAAKPVILIQTPYNRILYRASLASKAGPSFPYDTAHYNYAILDWRGFYGSKDAQVANYDRGLDGYDAVEWIALQPWCDGRVGTWGPSALGVIQFQTARRKPPHLLCSVPLVKDFKTKYSDYYYGGDLRKEHVESLERLGFLTVSAITSQPSENAIWKALERSSDYADEIGVPMLLIGGWFDHFPGDVIRAFEDLRASSADSVRPLHKLVMGPWLHSNVGMSKQGDLDFPGGQGVADRAALDFFDRYLRGLRNDYERRPDLAYYQMGANEWRSGPLWKDLPRVTDTLFLQGNGDLLRTRSNRAVSTSTLQCNPKNPSPSCGGARFNPFDPSVREGPLDIRYTVEARPDAIKFTTPVADYDYEIRGPVTVHLQVSSNRTDTDFGVRLCDVFPDGRSMIMTDGIRRARFRNSYEREEPMTPDTVYEVDIELQEIALTIVKGHQLRIVVTSSNYPRFDINPNSGGPLYQPGDTLAATNKVYHSATIVSCVTLGVKEIPTGIRPPERIPASCSIECIYPDPCADRASIGWTLSVAGTARISIYDALGRLRMDLPRGMTPAGRHETAIDLHALPAGSYECVLTTSDATAVRKFQVSGIK
jgi:uncharacterized protein